MAASHYRSSPRPWGCFRAITALAGGVAVFPTPVGVFLAHAAQAAPQWSLPHARGGVSFLQEVTLTVPLSSPRPWGCFYPKRCLPCLAPVFPTPVGVFPDPACTILPHNSLPHARGGVSISPRSQRRDDQSSPRPWGCFSLNFPKKRVAQVFPTPVGVFPFRLTRLSWRVGLPHARGGVSWKASLSSVPVWSSPRPWGCFYHYFSCLAKNGVFPTPVGVFPVALARASLSRGLPHARGGVSKEILGGIIMYQSSPRPWGCFCHMCAESARMYVVPTPVGVFPPGFG